jgi:DNA-directed RNA polymerase specialized sigma24 family protein
MPNNPRFATTRWTLVLQAGHKSALNSSSALAELCSTYWYPLYAYARRRGHDPDDARDLTQSFFAMLLEKGALGLADPARGRFRTFLLAAMQNFLAGEWRRQQTQKRGGAVEILSLDFDAAESSYSLEPSHDLDPEAVFERRWALSLIERAVADLREQYAAAGNGELFDALKGYLGSDGQAVPYAELAQRFSRGEGALRTAVSRLRSRWAGRIRDLVAETVEDESEIQDELSALLGALDGSL